MLDGILILPNDAPRDPANLLQKRPQTQPGYVEAVRSRKQNVRLWDRARVGRRNSGAITYVPGTDCERATRKRKPSLLSKRLLGGTMGGTMGGTP